MSVRTDDESETNGNKVSAMFASLATDIDDPAERLEAIRSSTEGAKEDHNAIGARTLTDWAEWAAPRTFGLAARLYSSMALADSHRPIHNLVISNVPGPPFPLYFAGAELVAAYPMGPVMDGAGLNITVLSYRNHIDIGFMADKDLVPDVWDLADAVKPAFEELKELAGNSDPTLVKMPAPVTATSKQARSASKAARVAPTEGYDGEPSGVHHPVDLRHQIAATPERATHDAVCHGGAVPPKAAVERSRRGLDASATPTPATSTRQRESAPTSGESRPSEEG